MNIAQILAHCRVTSEMVYDNKHPKPNLFLKFFLTKCWKKKVVSGKPYPENGKITFDGLHRMNKSSRGNSF